MFQVPGFMLDVKTKLETWDMEPETYLSCATFLRDDYETACTITPLSSDF